MRRLRFLSDLWHNFLSGDRAWAALRLVVVLLVLLAFIVYERLVFGSTDYRVVAEAWLAHYPFLAVLPEKLLWFVASIFTLHNLRYYVMPVAALLGALLIAANYVREIHELPRFWLGWRFVIASMFGIAYPTATVENGKIRLKPQEINLLDVIGGPGYLNVKPGSVVLLERISEPSNVYGAGRHFISRRERIRTIVSLDEQNGELESITATTKDGIEVIVSDIRFRYRLRAGRRPNGSTGGAPFQPYPFSVQAVRGIAFNGMVGPAGWISWHDAVTSAVRGAIAVYINEHQFDHLVAPREYDPDPRKELKERLSSKGTRSRLWNLGADLVWVDIGHFDAAQKLVSDQKVDTWGAKWSGLAQVQLAQGEAKQLYNRELGRAEAQAGILKSILQALQDLQLSPNADQNVRKIILVRTAQILEALTEGERSLDDGAGDKERDRKQLPPHEES